MPSRSRCAGSAGVGPGIETGTGRGIGIGTTGRASCSLRLFLVGYSAGTSRVHRCIVLCRRAYEQQQQQQQPQQQAKKNLKDEKSSRNTGSATTTAGTIQTRSSTSNSPTTINACDRGNGHQNYEKGNNKNSLLGLDLDSNEKQRHDGTGSGQKKRRMEVHMDERMQNALAGVYGSIRGGMCVCCVYDYLETRTRLESSLLGRLYSMMMAGLFKDILQRNTHIFDEAVPGGKEQMRTMFRNCWLLSDYDRIAAADLHGYDSEEHMASHVSLGYDVHEITVPYLAIQPLDDPLHNGAVRENLHVDEMIRANSNVIYMEPQAGNHFGFYEGPVLQAFSNSSSFTYPARVAVHFFRALLQFQDSSSSSGGSTGSSNISSSSGSHSNCAEEEEEHSTTTTTTTTTTSCTGAGAGATGTATTSPIHHRHHHNLRSSKKDRKIKSYDYPVSS